MIFKGWKDSHYGRKLQIWCKIRRIRLNLWFKMRWAKIKRSTTYYIRSLKIIGMCILNFPKKIFMMPIWILIFKVIKDWKKKLSKINKYISMPCKNWWKKNLNLYLYKYSLIWKLWKRNFKEKSRHQLPILQQEI